MAQGISEALKSVSLRIDPLEQALRDLCAFEVQGEGSRLAYRVAADNLRMGMSVIADSCNPIPVTRREWEEVAPTSKARFLNIKVICSDPIEPRPRVEHRQVTVPGPRLPTWEAVQKREYHAWVSERLVIDTAGKTPEESIRELIQKVIHLMH